MNNTLRFFVALALSAAPIQAQRAVAYEGTLLGEFTKFDKVTTLDNGLGIGAGVAAYILPRLSIGYTGDMTSSTSARTRTDLTVLNHRINATYNQPLTDKWRALVGGGWTGTRFNGDTTKNEYDSGVNALVGLRYCVNDSWSWKIEGLADFKDPADQAPSFSKTTTYVLRVGLSKFFGGQAKNGPCIANAEPMPAPPPPAVMTPAAQQPPAQQPPAQQPPAQQPPAQQPPAPQPPAPQPPAPQPPAQQPPAQQPAPRSLMSFSPVYFSFDRSTLSAAARDTLDGVVRFMQANPNARVNVIGHTDSMGDDDYNMRLGTRRAIIVRDYLTSKGIAANRITTMTRGEAEPAADNATAEGRAKNRRAVVVEVR